MAPEPTEQRPRGISDVTRGPAGLSIPRTVPADSTQRYGLGFPFQAGRDTAGLFCNLRMIGYPTWDFENGTDVVLFDSLDHIDPGRATAISRNERFTDPATGEPSIAVKYPVIGGFVPIGALREDGTPHPHAGTGFGICQSLAFELNAQDCFDWAQTFTHRVP